MNNTITEGNFLLYAAHHYLNPCVDEIEFQDDLNRIRNLKRLFKRYEDTGELKERLILNHLVILYNVFEREAITKMLCFKLFDQLSYLKPFLVLLNYWPERVDGISKDNLTIMSSDILMDTEIVKNLRKI
jgi:hypothetical protein